MPKVSLGIGSDFFGFSWHQFGIFCRGARNEMKVFAALRCKRWVPSGRAAPASGCKFCLGTSASADSG